LPLAGNKALREQFLRKQQVVYQGTAFSRAEESGGKAALAAGERRLTMLFSAKEFS
jgi:hypothetical protein